MEYERFDKILLDSLFNQISSTETHFTHEKDEMEEEEEDSSLVWMRGVSLPLSIREEVQKVISNEENEKGEWNEKSFTPFNLPSPLDLLLADVHGGSSTPSMVKKILKWKGGSDGKLWEDIQESNNTIILLFKHLDETFPQQLMSDVCTQLSTSSYHTWDEIGGDSNSISVISVISMLQSIRIELLKVRSMLKEMGRQAGVDVEPDEQTSLANETCELPGVLGCGVPGAGGNDALFAIVLHESVRESVEEFWLSYHQNESLVTPLLLTTSSEGLTITKG